MNAPIALVAGVGRGTGGAVARRFATAGYTKPKPFIDVHGKPMIVRVIENLSCDNARFILIVRGPSSIELE